jgi:hypothetical protein
MDMTVECARCGRRRPLAEDVDWPQGAERTATGERICSDVESCTAAVCARLDAEGLLLFDDDVSETEQAEAGETVAAFARWTQAGRDGDWRAAATMLAYRFPERWAPPPDDVRMADLRRWLGGTAEQMRRWLDLGPSSTFPPLNR